MLSTFKSIVLDTCPIHRRPPFSLYKPSYYSPSPVNINVLLYRERPKAGMGGGIDPDNKKVIDQLMLRFRPIAPRPMAAERSAGLLPAKEKRVKRKYVRVKNNKNKKKKINEECNYYNYTSLDRSEFVTSQVRRVPEWISFDVSGKNSISINTSNSNNIMSRWITPSIGLPGLHEADLSTVLNPHQSWITVESIIGSCDDGGRGVGYTDLEMDSCPCFISDGFDEVRWVNLAYRRLVDPNPEGGSLLPPSQVSVVLDVKVEKIDFEYWPAFSCRVRLVYDLSEKKKKQMTVPCDVWKMDSGGYAWRLDVKAALSLGRLD